MLLIICISCFFVIIISFFFFAFIYNLIRDKKFRNQNYLSKDKIILITGGCLGIGREIIHNLITLFNCKIINLDMRESEFNNLKEKYKDNITNIHCDISEIKNIISFLSENKINPDNIDIIINNAGIANNFPIEKLTEKQILTTIETNLIAPIKIIKSFLDNKSKKKLKDKKIHFITLCSVMSHIVSANSSDYIASKWGLYGFMESIRNEYLFNNDYIFTSICPYAINTGMFPNPPKFPLLPILEPKKIGKEIVKCIALKEKIKFFPSFIDIPIFIYKLVPCFLNDLFQYYIINRMSIKIGRRNDNEIFLKSMNKKEEIK